MEINNLSHVAVSGAAEESEPLDAEGDLKEDLEGDKVAEEVAEEVSRNLIAIISASDNP